MKKVKQVRYINDRLGNEMNINVQHVEGFYEPVYPFEKVVVTIHSAGSSTADILVELDLSQSLSSI